MGNKNAGSRNAWTGNAVCKHPSPDGKNFCSLARDHRGDYHKAYTDHATHRKSCFLGEWLVAGKGVSQDDVDAAIASITGVYVKPGVALPVQVPVPTPGEPGSMQIPALSPDEWEMLQKALSAAHILATAVGQVNNAIWVPLLDKVRAASVTS